MALRCCIQSHNIVSRSFRRNNRNMPTQPGDIRVIRPSRVTPHRPPSPAPSTWPQTRLACQCPGRARGRQDPSFHPQKLKPSETSSRQRPGRCNRIRVSIIPAPSKRRPTCRFAQPSLHPDLTSAAHHTYMQINGQMVAFVVNTNLSDRVKGDALVRNL